MDRDDLLVRVAWLYYMEDLTQQEIGDRLNLPRVRVTRLLKEARDKGVIEFRIARKHAAHLELERELRQAFELADARVVPTPLDGERLRSALGDAAAQYLQLLYRPGFVIGLGMGRTLAEIPKFAQPMPEGDCHFVEMVGGAGLNELGFDTYNVSWRLAELCGGVVEHIYSPVVVETPEVHRALLSDPQIQAALDQAAHADVALVGIGAVEDSVLHHLGYFGDADLEDLRRRRAVGDILGRFYDLQGKPVPTSLDERLVGLDLSQLAGIPRVVGVAGGTEKVRAILGALRGGYLNVLITDEATAKGVLETAESTVEVSGV